MKVDVIFKFNYLRLEYFEYPYPLLRKLKKNKLQFAYFPFPKRYCYKKVANVH